MERRHWLHEGLGWLKNHCYARADGVQAHGDRSGDSDLGLAVLDEPPQEGANPLDVFGLLGT